MTSSNERTNDTGIQEGAGLSRRDFLVRGGSMLALLAMIDSPLFARMAGAADDGEVIPFLDRPPATPDAAVKAYGELNRLDWQKLTQWITPNDQFFTVSHYNRPVIRPEEYKLELTGLVKNPKTFTLAELKRRPRQEVVFTLECAGNHGFEWFTGGIGTAKWAGTPLAPLLKEAGLKPEGLEVIFFGADAGDEEVRSVKMHQEFSRSLSVPDALRPEVLLCYEMNGEPLPQEHGFPVRLIVPGWYGVANVKWLSRVDVTDRRWAGRFMTRDYVTIREEVQPGGRTVWTQKVVGPARVKSVTARVVSRGGHYQIEGAAWGGLIDRVEVRVDSGPWVPATITRGNEQDFAWKFWSLDWTDPAPGEHTITSRAVDRQGNIQPAADDPLLTKKHTYWESNGQITRRILLPFF
ncbi:MAG: sulfite oxidase [Nitrospirota bacterium]|nr:sulfite oxidase [Nitrospirota bacterium]